MPGRKSDWTGAAALNVSLSIQVFNAFQCKPRTVAKHEKNKRSKNILRSHDCSCIISVERGGVGLDDSVI